MPTKPNRAGQQQNYVPQGNGDASGEYADHASGSNIHFTNFKKPDGDKIVGGSGKTENNITEDETKGLKKFAKPDNDGTNDIKTIRKSAKNTLIKKCVNGSRENDITFGDLVDDSNDESVTILDGYLKENEKLSIEFGGAGRNAAGYASKDNYIRTDHEIHTIRHELGHTFDCFYGNQMPSARHHYLSDDYASCRFVDDETGKTMNEMLHEELGVSMYKAGLSGYSFKFYKEGKDKREVKLESAKRIVDIYNKYCDKIYDEKTGVPNAREKWKELRIKYNESNDFVRREIENTEIGRNYARLRSEVYKAENDYAREMFRNGATSVTYSDSPKVRELRNQADKMRETYNQEKDKMFMEKMGKEDYELYTKLSKNQYLGSAIEGANGLVGDTLDYLNVGASAIYGLRGHGKGYFDKRKETGYALEVFANMFDCYMSKDSWKRDFVKEAFPKTSKIFEKIYFGKGGKK